MKKKTTRKIFAGSVPFGGGAPIVVQSMTSTDTRDVEATVRQILKLEKLGCEIVRIAIPDMEAAKVISQIKKRIHIPLVADIHFDHKLAIESVKRGIDKIRINPGNIGSIEKVRAVVEVCKDKKIPIRIGVNAGSLEKELLKKYGSTPEAAVESALRHVRILEKLNFKNILISIKFNNIADMINSYRMLVKKVSYPLHLGVTHAGTPYMGTIKNAIGIGELILEGIGDTIRVSLTGDPCEEIKAGFSILKAVGKRQNEPEIISCPGCGRAQIDVVDLAEKVEKIAKKIKKNIKIAVMGCSVNGPGEAREADVGIAGGNGMAAIFLKGQILKTVKERDILPELLKEIKKII